jgi:ribosomal protein L11 methyltransferase
VSPAHLEVSVRLERRHAELAEQLMLAQGAQAVTLSEGSDTPMWEPEPGSPSLWEEVCISGLFSLDSNRERLCAALSLLPLASGPESREVAGQAWERAWMERFKPMRFGRRLWIIPSGFEAPDPDGQLLHLDPGLAFGTGSHDTTRLCLEWLDGLALEGLDVVDLGCGSGVLGIAAAIKGARHVLCIDNDPQAVEATLENARRNDVAGRITATVRPDMPPAGADVLVANILAGTLVALAPAVAAALKPGGLLALSGVLAEQQAQVQAAYAGSCGPLQVRSVAEPGQLPAGAGGQDERWVLLSGQRLGTAKAAGSGP